MNEYSRIEDEIYSLNSFTRLKFHSKITEIKDGKSRSFYNEYKTNNRNEGSVLIKRKFEYYLTLDYSYKGERDSVLLLPEQMYEIIDKFQYIKNTWFNSKSNFNIFGLVNENLVVIDSRETIIIRCCADKILKLDPAIFKSDNGDKPALTICIGDTTFPIMIQPERFIGMLYILSNLDMANFANTSLSLASMRKEPCNRISFADEDIEESKPTNSDKSGRDFKFKQQNNLII